MGSVLSSPPKMPSPHWHRWLVEIPEAIIDGYGRALRLFIAIGGIVIWLSLLVLLISLAFGVRWGW